MKFKEMILRADSKNDVLRVVCIEFDTNLNVFSPKHIILGLYELFRWVYVRCEGRDCVAR